MVCIGELCNYSINFSLDYASCGGGSGTCAEATMKTTNLLPTTHDGHIKGATTAIQAILRNLKTHTPPGKQLKFLNVLDGVMLAWVDEVIAADDGIQAFAPLELIDAPTEELQAG